MKKKLSIALSALCLAVLGVVGLPTPTYAEGGFCDSSQIGDIAADICNTSESDTALQEAIMGILTFVISSVAIVAVIFVVIGAVGYMTASGDANKLKKAKDTILYALIGLVICAFAFMIVNFVVSTLNKSAGNGGGNGGGGDSSQSTEG